jgi:hypothetical protein
MSLDTFHSTMGVGFLVVWIIVAQIIVGDRTGRIERVGRTERTKSPLPLVTQKL